MRVLFLLILLTSTASFSQQIYTIGILSNIEEKDGTYMITSYPKYKNAITKVCGKHYISVIIPAQNANESAKYYVSKFDGILLPGNNNDIDPKYYNENVANEANHTEKLRNDFEFALIKASAAKRKPLLGICAGAQAINVAFGGNLIQDIKTMTNSSIDHNHGTDTQAHDVIVSGNTVLSKALFKDHKRTGDTKISTNSAHHQAMHKLGSGIIKSATATNGITEAIEVSGQKFMVGVQWHPEVLLSNEDENLIKSFCNASANKSSTKHHNIAKIIKK